MCIKLESSPHDQPAEPTGRLGAGGVAGARGRGRESRAAASWSRHVHTRAEGKPTTGGGEGWGSEGVYRCRQGALGHVPPGKATEGWWQKVTLYLRQGSCNGRIRPGTTTHVSPSSDTVLDKGRILQSVATPRSCTQPFTPRFVCAAVCGQLQSNPRAGQGGAGRAGAAQGIFVSMYISGQNNCKQRPSERPWLTDVETKRGLVSTPMLIQNKPK